MSELLDRIHTEIRDRLRAHAPAVREYKRLEAALAALGSGGPPPRPAAAAPPGTQPSTPRRSSVRAPRGANRAAVLRVLGDRPGVSVAELSAASGVTKPVLYNLLRTLEQRGEITKEQLPGDSTGYRLVPEEPTQRPSDAPDSILETS